MKQDYNHLHIHLARALGAIRDCSNQLDTQRSITTVTLGPQNCKYTPPPRIGEIQINYKPFSCSADLMLCPSRNTFLKLPFCRL